MSTSAPLNVCREPWELNEARCPCDVHLVEWLDLEQIRDVAIFHFGTGAHHYVGVENARPERHNAVFGITASPQEYETYLKLVLERPDVLRFYIAIFGDIYILNKKLLPIFDVVTLFHICEFRSEKNDAYGGLTDLQLATLLTDKTRPGGYIIFYRGSFVFDRKQGTKDVITLWEKQCGVKYIGRFKSLLIYQKTSQASASLKRLLNSLLHSMKSR